MEVENVQISEERVRELISKSKQFRENFRHFRERSEEVRKDYAGQIIVFVDGKVVAHHEFTTDPSTMSDFLKEVEKKIGKEKADNALLYYIPKPGETLML